MQRQFAIQDIVGEEMSAAITGQKDVDAALADMPKAASTNCSPIFDRGGECSAPPHGWKQSWVERAVSLVHAGPFRRASRPEDTGQEKLKGRSAAGADCPLVGAIIVSAATRRNGPRRHPPVKPRRLSPKPAPSMHR